MNPITYVIVNVSIIALLYTGAIRVDSGILTQGQIVALVNYMSQILVELVKLANLIITVTKAIACGNRVQSVLEVQNSMELADVEQKIETDKNAPAVVFDHVCLTYAGAGSESLTDISFTAKHGETIGIIGGTGSGKSSAGQSDPPFLRCDKGTCPGRRRGRQRVQPGSAAQQDWHRAAESSAVCRNHCRESALGKEGRVQRRNVESAGNFPVKRVC